MERFIPNRIWRTFAVRRSVAYVFPLHLAAGLRVNLNAIRYYHTGRGRRLNRILRTVLLD